MSNITNLECESIAGVQSWLKKPRVFSSWFLCQEYHCMVILTSRNTKLQACSELNC